MPERLRSTLLFLSAPLAGALGGVVLALASPDPETQTLNDGGVPLLIGAAVLAVAFVVRELHTTDPLVPLGALRRPGAWGSLLVSVLVGAALIAALERLERPDAWRTPLQRVIEALRRTQAVAA